MGKLFQGRIQYPQERRVIAGFAEKLHPRGGPIEGVVDIASRRVACSSRHAHKLRGRKGRVKKIDASPLFSERIRAMYTGRIQRFRARLRHDDNQHYEENAATMRRLQLELLNEERRAAIDLRDREVINDDVLRDIEHDIDLEELRVKEDDFDNDE
jgi:hypothetical protein